MIPNQFLLRKIHSRIKEEYRNEGPILIRPESTKRWYCELQQELSVAGLARMDHLVGFEVTMSGLHSLVDFPSLPNLQYLHLYGNRCVKPSKTRYNLVKNGPKLLSLPIGPLIWNSVETDETKFGQFLTRTLPSYLNWCAKPSKNPVNPVLNPYNSIPDC